MNQMASNNIQFQQNMSAPIRDLQTQIGAKFDDSAKTDFAPKQISLPFPSKSIPAKKVELGFYLFETFKKVKVNIPLLDVIKQIPKYGKFLKDLCTYKRKLKGNEQVKMGRYVSALIQSKSVATIPSSTLPQSAKIQELFLSLIPLEIELLQMSCLTLELQLMSCPNQFTDHYILVI